MFLTEHTPHLLNLIGQFVAHFTPFSGGLPDFEHMPLAVGIFGFLGKMFGGGGAGDSAKKAYSQFDKIKTPELKALALKKYSIVADPRDFIKAMADSGLSQYNADPELRSAQTNALHRLEQVGAEKGLTTEDRAKIKQVQDQESIREKGQRDAITQGAQSRGMGRSGIGYQALLANQQGSAERTAASGTQIASDASRRALEAVTAAGNLGGQIRTQDFGEAERKAAAQDTINQFNTTQMNNAGLLTAEQKQRVAEQNIGLSNEQRRFNTIQLPQQNFQNSMTLATQKANALNKVGAASQDKANFGLTAAKTAAGALSGIF